MEPVILIGVSIFLAVFAAASVGFTKGVQAMEAYERKFTLTAEKNLAELFIFIDPKKLYVINIGILVVTLLVVWVFTGIFFVALFISCALAMVPQLLYRYLRYRRIEDFNAALPDALMSIASMLRAGTNVSKALEVTVAEHEGPIAEEFGLFLNELKVGVDFYDALDNLYKRMPIQDLQMVIAGMKISRDVGGSLADVLARLSDTIRRKLEMEGKIRSLTAMGKAQGFVMGVLPLFLGYVMYKMEPESTALFFTDIRGWFFSALVVVLLALGFYFIKKIVTIDV